MNKKVIGLIAIVVVIVACGGAAALYVLSPANQAPRTPTGKLDFTVTASSDCLRFLNSTVPTIYVPFTIAANEKWQLTVNCTKMPGGNNGWTDVYIYKGYWDGGTNHACKAGDLYPILSNIESANFEITSKTPYIQIFTNTIQQSFTVFFVVPPGGQPATFHVTLKPT